MTDGNAPVARGYPATEVQALIEGARYAEPADGTAESAWNAALEHIEEGLALLPAPAQGAVSCGGPVAWQSEKDQLMLWIASLLNQIGKLETAALSSTGRNTP